MSMILLEITSYRGISIGGIHFYGRIYAHYDSHYNKDNRYGSSYELKYPIEQKHLDMMDKLCNPWDWDPEDWPIGMETSRFFTKEDVIKAGIKSFKKNYNSSMDILVDWKPVYIWNRVKNKVIAGNRTIMKKVNDGEFRSDRETDMFLRKLG